jgi:hypothetical protein
LIFFKLFRHLLYFFAHVLSGFELGEGAINFWLRSLLLKLEFASLILESLVHDDLFIVKNIILVHISFVFLENVNLLALSERIGLLSLFSSTSTLLLLQ